MEGNPLSGPALSATHSHLSFCLRSTSSLLSGSGNSAVSAAQAAMDDSTKLGGDCSEEDVLQRRNENEQEAGPAMETGFGKLNDEVHDQKLGDGDAAQLFLASSLKTNNTNDETLADNAKRKEEIKTASTNPATHLTSEEEGIDMGRRGLLHPGVSDLVTSVHTESEGGIILEKCDKEALDLVEGALLRMLSGNSAAQLRENLPVKASGDWKTSEVEKREQIPRSPNSEESVSSGAEKDMQMLAKLLEEVHTLRSRKKKSIQTTSEPRSEKDYGIWATAPRRTACTDKRAGSKEKKFSKNDELRLTLEAAAQAAKAAADAAQAAAASVAKNSETIEMLLRTLSPSLSTSIAEQLENHPRFGRGRRRRKPKVEETEPSEVEEGKPTKKEIVKQNRMTHWILGFMVVTTIAWRFGVVKVANRLKHKLSNPLDYVGGLLGGEKEPESETEAAEETSKNNLLSQIMLPSILQGDEQKETDKPTAPKDPEAKKKEEEKVFNFGNILQIKPNSK